MSRKKKVKNVEQIVASGSESQRFVLVGTYKKKTNQLAWIGKRHMYNYPLSADEVNAMGGAWNKVKELWLYSGTKDKRHIYAAEFVGVKSREDFLAEHPDYPRSKGGKSMETTMSYSVSNSSTNQRQMMLSQLFV